MQDRNKKRRFKASTARKMGRMTNYQVYLLYRRFASKYLGLWENPHGEGFTIYSDKLPDMQEMRADAEELLTLKWQGRGT